MNGYRPDSIVVFASNFFFNEKQTLAFFILLYVENYISSSLFLDSTLSTIRLRSVLPRKFYFEDENNTEKSFSLKIQGR